MLRPLVELARLENLYAVLAARYAITGKPIPLKEKISWCCSPNRRHSTSRRGIIFLSGLKLAR
jgi:hypothetical protein